MTQGPWLVVGLGNPGDRYQGTRHNIGQQVVDLLAERAAERFVPASGPGGQRPRAVSVTARVGVLPGGAPGPSAVLLKPTTYMNESGGPVGQAQRYLGVPVDRLVVVHDDLDLPFGTLRLKRGGGEGGHNGLKDITRAVGSRDYLRVRCGIGRPPGRQDPADFVLRPFSAAERSELAFLVDDAADAVVALVVEGLESAQQRFHAPRPS